jgi:hypothetical protein
MVLYIAMAYIIKAAAGFYVYDFMDTSLLGALTAAYIFGIGAIGVVTFFVVQGVVWLKFCCGGRRVHRAQDDLPGWDFNNRVEEGGFYGEKSYSTPR